MNCTETTWPKQRCSKANTIISSAAQAPRAAYWQTVSRRIRSIACLSSKPAVATIPADAPAIQPNYLSTDEDRRVAAESIHVTRNIVAQSALKLFNPVEYLPGESVGEDDVSLAKAAGDIGTTIFHPVGTAKMGRDSDPLAVVDERLRVFGLDRIRVIDASVMPTITSGNTNSPTIMIAEKGAAMIREDTRR